MVTQDDVGEHWFNYSVCSNGESCPDGIEMMVASFDTNNLNRCYEVAFWDESINPTYSSDNGGTFIFEYYGMYTYIYTDFEIIMSSKLSGND